MHFFTANASIVNSRWITTGVSFFCLLATFSCTLLPLPLLSFISVLLSQGSLSPLASVAVPSSAPIILIHRAKNSTPPLPQQNLWHPKVLIYLLQVTKNSEPFSFTLFFFFVGFHQTFFDKTIPTTTALSILWFANRNKNLYNLISHNGVHASFNKPNC